VSARINENGVKTEKLGLKHDFRGLFLGTKTPAGTKCYILVPVGVWLGTKLAQPFSTGQCYHPVSPFSIDRYLSPVLNDPTGYFKRKACLTLSHMMHRSDGKETTREAGSFFIFWV
jgi:hypothetical protein